MEKKNLTVLVSTADTAATDNAVAADFVTGLVYMVDAENNQAVDDGSLNMAEISNGLYFAVKNADGSYIRTDTIMPRNITMITEVDPVDAAGQVTTIDGVDNIDCETEYCLTLTYNSPEIAKNYGYQAMKETYSYVTRCCGTSCGCPDGAVWDVAMGLAEQLNNDQESQMNLPAATAKTIMYAVVKNSTAVVDANDPVEA